MPKPGSPESPERIPNLEPVQRLNEDALRLIVGEAVAQDDVMALTCSSVCKFWRETTLNMPQAWSTIYLIHRSKGVEYFHFCLTHAGSVPLSIKIYNHYYSMFIRYLRAIASQSHRIESLELSIPEKRRYSGIFHLTPALPSFPSTRNLTISGVKSGFYVISSVLAEFFGSRATFPKLEDLTLDDMYINGGKLYPISQSLRRLELCDCVSINLDGANFPSLQELCCHNLKPQENASPWNFPELTVLIYTSKPDPEARIPKIRAPKLVMLKYCSLSPPELLGETPHLKELQVLYHSSQEGERDLIWSRPSVTSMTVCPWDQRELEGFFDNLSDLPPSLKILNIDELFKDDVVRLKGALERRSIAVAATSDPFSDYPDF